MPEIIDQPPDGQSLKDDDALAELEEAEARGSGAVYKIQRSFGMIWRGVASFEERHPWVFFGLASVIVFVIILFVVSLFTSSGTDRPREVQPKESVQEEKDAQREATVTPSTVSVGAIEGIDAARLLSDPATAIELTSPLARLERSGFLGTNVSNASANLLTTVMHVESVVGIDVLNVLDNSDDRQESYDRYVDALSALERRASLLYNGLARQHMINTQEIAVLVTQKNEASVTMNALLSEGASTDDIEDSLKEYSDLISESAKRQAEDEILIDVLNSTRAPIEAAQLRLAGMIANEEALVAGITVVDIDGSGVELGSTGIAEEFYSSEELLGTNGTTSVPISRTRARDRITPTQLAPSPGAIGTNTTFRLPPLEVLGLEEAYSGKNN